MFHLQGKTDKKPVLLDVTRLKEDIAEPSVNGQDPGS